MLLAGAVFVFDAALVLSALPVLGAVAVLSALPVLTAVAGRESGRSINSSLCQKS